jgi:tryptophanyl-tRNA synthetase
MSKSYNNTIPLFCDEKSLRKLVLSLQTDSSPLEAPKQLAGTLLEEYLKSFSTPAHLQDLSHRLAQGGLGWGHAKQELFEVMNTTIAPMRARYLELRDDRAMLDKVLADGAERGFAIAYKVLQRVRDAVGLRNYLVRG